MEAVPLHQHPMLLVQCCEILNAEWPRSETARLHSLQKSCDQLPCSLALIESKDRIIHVIGHSRLCRVVGQQEACWIESVVIIKTQRGRGLGRLLMGLTEDYARRMGFSLIYLSTHDKQEFYKKLGYTFCSPVQLFGSPAKAVNKAKSMLLKSSNNNSQTDRVPAVQSNDDHTGATPTSEKLSSNANATRSEEQRNMKTVIPPPPPPLVNHSCNQNSMPKKQWMKKFI